jgi:hypothetical protein
MSNAGSLTVTCPRCGEPFQVSAALAGEEVLCRHAACGRAFTVPLPLEDDEPIEAVIHDRTVERAPEPAPAADDEPDEPVLLPEDPANPQDVPIAAATAPVRRSAKAVPRPRTRPKPPPLPRDKSERNPRAVLLPWILAAVAFVVATGAATGWVATSMRGRSADRDAERLAVLETRYRDLRAENQKLREQLEPPAPVAAAPPKRPDTPPPVPSRPPVEEPAPAAPVPFRPNFPRPPRPNLGRPAEARDAFVGVWTINDRNVQANNLGVTITFRADGTFGIDVENPGVAGMNQIKGKWRWDGQLHLELDDLPNSPKPADVKWNGPDEFVATVDNVPTTFRRKGKP